MEHRVVAYSGCCYAQEPREFYLDDEHHFVRKVEDVRLVETRGMEGMPRHVWRVTDENGSRFELTYYWVSDFWEIAAL